MRTVQPDPLYNNLLVAKFINKVMKNGKKTVAQKQVYEAFRLISEQKADPLVIFQKAIENVSPKLEVRSRRIGGANYQVPTEVKSSRRISLAMKWIIESARKKSNKEYHHFSQKLAKELMEAAEGQGEAVKKKETTHKMAEANKVFSHFRW